MKGTTLLIDDDTFIQKLYQSEFEARGLPLKVAVDGEQGLRLAAELKPNVILLDVIMPKKNGFEVLAELKKNPATASIPVIMFSHLAQDADKKRGSELGAVDYLVKDEVTEAEVFAAVERFL